MYKLIRNQKYSEINQNLVLKPYLNYMNIIPKCAYEFSDVYKLKIKESDIYKTYLKKDFTSNQKLNYYIRDFLTVGMEDNGDVRLAKVEKNNNIEKPKILEY